MMKRLPDLQQNWRCLLCNGSSL